MSGGLTSHDRLIGRLYCVLFADLRVSQAVKQNAEFTEGWQNGDPILSRM